MNVEGPIGTADSLPFGSVVLDGGEQSRLLKEFDYVEEEFFISGTADVYGPETSRRLESGDDQWTFRLLSTARQSDAPFQTRAMVIRPRDPARFSGIAHVVPVLYNGTSIERYLLRHGDAWVGLEVCEGFRLGPEEIPTGGIAHLRQVNPDRYGDLVITGGNPSDWGELSPGSLGKAFERLNFGQPSHEMEVFLQELWRSYAQAPDIFFGLVAGIRAGTQTVLPGFEVRRIYSSAASGSAQVLRCLIDYHHDVKLLPDDRAPVDGYFIRVGTVPAHRPLGAVVVVFVSEAEAVHTTGEGWDLPQDSDDPRFRHYELPGTGHRYSAMPKAEAAQGGIPSVIPAGVRGLSERDISTEYELYDKVNAPIEWALWDALYRWVDEGAPMPRAEPITRDPAASDGIARDEHGNALGGVRTPWVDVPDATYVSRISPGNPLSAGMKRFSDEKMRALYGTREEYERRVNEKLEEMIRDRWLLAEDVQFMFASRAL